MYVNVHQEMFQRSFFESLKDQLSEGPNRQSQVQGDSIIKTLPTVDAFWSFSSGRTGHFIKKNTTQKGKFCFASPMEMASHFSIETNKQVTSTLLLCCVFFYWWQEPPFEKEMDQGRPVGGHDVGVGHVWVMERVMKIHEISPENVPRVGYEIRQ